MVFSLALVLLGSSPSFCSAAGKAPSPWSYTGKLGPANWGGVCSSGREQSPIDVVKAESTALGFSSPLLSFSYPAQSSFSVLNSGKTAGLGGMEGQLQIHGQDGAVEHQLELIDIHFHAPSENTLDGKQFDLEMHMVHKSESGVIAVVGVLFEGGRGSSPALLEDVLASIPQGEGISASVEKEADLQSLFPSSTSMFHWMGSLTTPPCSEGLRWFLLEEPVPMKAHDLTRFRAFFGRNARPVQPLNGREIMYWEEPEMPAVLP